MDPKNTLHPSIAANALPKEGTQCTHADGSGYTAPHPHARPGYIASHYIGDREHPGFVSGVPFVPMVKTGVPMAKSGDVFLFKQVNHEGEFDSIAQVRSFLPATDQYVIRITMANYCARDTIGRGAFHARAQLVGTLKDVNTLAIDHEVITAIQSEREYQNLKWVDHKHSLGEWVLILRKLVADLEAVTVKQGYTAGQHELRQLATTAIVAMEQCGAPLRKRKAPDALDPVTINPKRLDAVQHTHTELLRKINEASLGELVSKELEGCEAAKVKSEPEPLHRGLGFSLERIKEEEVNSYQRYVESRTNGDTNGDTLDVQMNLHALWMRNLGELRHQHAAVASFKGIA